MEPVKKFVIEDSKHGLLEGLLCPYCESGDTVIVQDTRDKTIFRCMKCGHLSYSTDGLVIENRMD
ncbi:hypothetical protein [Methanogenium organophilum]|uniref:Uncharacterized protein n=1 Tax=Methanogenium organophilum TaxID=2199 RepID=A0A9X9S5E1_METOG|nr:hypothetical protein [Methanogenium organophilum]WAI01235.1 hypothetical protein OU421_12610 [Methanogenium organophilum]